MATSLLAARKKMGNIAMENIFGCITFSSLVITGTASFMGEFSIRYICFIAVYISPARI